MRISVKAFVAAAVVGAGVTSAVAGPVYFRLSGGTRATDPCFTRTYGPDHLARNPNQLVTRFFVIRERTGVPDENNEQRFTVRVGFRLKNDRDSYTTNAVCTTNGANADCLGEGDTGEFRIELRGDAVRVQVTRLEVEGSRGASPDLATGDDRVFLLQSSPRGVCTAG